MLYEVRENFLDRQSPLMLTHENSLVQAHSHVHSVPIFKSRQPLYSPFSHQANTQLSSESVLVAETQDEYNFHRNQVEDMTTSMYCPSANIIAPDFVSQLDSTGHVVLDIGDQSTLNNTFSKQGDFPEIVGNPMMQLILPASEINLLNGNLDSFFKEGMEGLDQDEDLAMIDEGSQVYYEIGCQVYEVNKIIY